MGGLEDADNTRCYFVSPIAARNEMPVSYVALIM